jgi:hypothetical protein
LVASPATISVTVRTPGSVCLATVYACAMIRFACGGSSAAGSSAP